MKPINVILLLSALGLLGGVVSYTAAQLTAEPIFISVAYYSAAAGVAVAFLPLVAFLVYALLERLGIVRSK